MPVVWTQTPCGVDTNTPMTPTRVWLTSLPWCVCKRFPGEPNKSSLYRKKLINYTKLESKPCIQDAEVFWYKTEIKILYIVQLCLIVCDCMVYSDPTFLIARLARSDPRNSFSGIVSPFYLNFRVFQYVLEYFIIDYFRLDQIGSNWFKLDPNWSNLFKHVQTWSNLFKLDQNGSKWF